MTRNKQFTQNEIKIFISNLDIDRNDIFIGKKESSITKIIKQLENYFISTTN